MKTNIGPSDFLGCGWIIVLLIMLLIISLCFNLRSRLVELLDSSFFRFVGLVLGIILAYLVTDKDFIGSFLSDNNPFFINAALTFFHGIDVRSGKNLDNFYIVSVTLGVALIAAAYAAESLYRKKMEDGVERFKENYDLFEKSLTFSFVVSLALVLESMLGLYFSLNDQPLFTASVFGIMLSSVLVTARLIMMSMALKFRNIF